MQMQDRRDLKEVYVRDDRFRSLIPRD